ncbi:MAG: transcription termination factor Rho [Sedimentisphaerales bacterium]|nr:transcription termination factor Rho [Sedimentisphaerales bacterium]
MTDTIQGILKSSGKQQFVLRTADKFYQSGKNEVLVHPNLLKQFKLTEGASVTGKTEINKGRCRLISIDSIGGLTPAEFSRRSGYSDLTAIDPHERFDLGSSGQESMRIVDLIAPIGKGTRQLIVSPPRAGKTVLLEQMIQAINHCSPKTRIIVLLVDERPEEVTSFRRAAGKAEIVASTSDHSADEHVELCEMILRHVQTELECGREIVLLIDSLTRIARAFNNMTRRKDAPRHHTMSGGLEAGVLEIPRRLFGLARNIENGGSITIVATCLINTGSRMDDLIFEEFKGTGNSEIVLDRSLAEARIFPAIDIPSSGTRKEAKLYNQIENKGLATLRRVLSSYHEKEAMKALFMLMAKYPTNKEFLKSMSAGV